MAAPLFTIDYYDPLRALVDPNNCIMSEVLVGDVKVEDVKVAIVKRLDGSQEASKIKHGGLTSSIDLCKLPDVRAIEMYIVRMLNVPQNT